MNTKVCIHCKNNKKLSYFYIDNKRKDKHCVLCIECQRKYKIKYYKQKKEEKKLIIRVKIKGNNSPKYIIRKNKADYKKYKYKNNSNFKITNLLRAKVSKAVKFGTKKQHTLNLLGCTITFLKHHLQQTAINNGYMDFNIENYSGKKYHIDHIIPCSTFNLNCNFHQKLCFNYMNLQILKAKENLEKQSKIAA